MIPNILFEHAVRAFPVPLSFVAKISGVYAYSTAYMTLEEKEYAQFQPRRALEVEARVDKKMKRPVRTVDSANAPFRPI
jgi:hypothetical protein